MLSKPEKMRPAISGGFYVRGGWLNITSHEMICFCKLMVVGVDEFSGLGAEKAYFQRLSGCSFWAWMDSPKNVRYLEDHPI